MQDQIKFDIWLFMQAALKLGIPPNHFWQMTPKEILEIIMTVQAPIVSPLTKNELFKLQQQFPD